MNALVLKTIAKGSWVSILTALGIRESFLRNRLGPCPGCGGKDRFRFDDRTCNGDWFCNQCEPKKAGDGFALLQHVYGWEFRDALKAVAFVLGVNNSSLPIPVLMPRPLKASLPEFDKQNIERALKLWSRAEPIQKGDPAHLYLTKTRGLSLSNAPQELRYHPRLCFDLESQIFYPGLLVKFTAPNGDFWTVQRIFLTNDGRKAVEKAKRFYPKGRDLRGGSAKLSEPTDILGIAEGIENALSCQELFNIPTWAACSSNLMASLVVPDTVRTVIIFPDKDKSGMKAANALATRLYQEGRTVKIIPPSDAGQDWNDALLEQRRTA